MKKQFIVKGTHCKSCKMLIEDVASEISGIQSCEVNYETGETVVEHDENIVWEKFKEEIEKLGDYKVEGI